MKQPTKVVPPVRLKDYDPGFSGGLNKDSAREKTEKFCQRIGELQELLYANARHAVLILLQGMDCSGKDGTVKRVLEFVNPAGVETANFKTPSAEERAHDFLWRIHQQTPRRGEITIFNRSHYEDVLVVRVHKLVENKVWRSRFNHINNFEKLLADSHTIVLKFYLHISKKEQLQRLLEREQDQGKYWKLSAGDWKEREHWNDYTRAYEDAINRCSSPQAPWFIVPADKKWFRNLAVAEAIVTAMRPYRKQWMDKLARIGQAEKARIDEFRKAAESRK